MRSPELTTLACPICESHSRASYRLIGLGAQPSGVQDFPVLKCKLHGVEFADALPAPTSEQEKRTSLDRLYGAARESQPRYVEFMDKLEAVVGKGAGRTLLDVGCGNGQLVLEARRRGWTVEGSDIVPGLRAEIEKLGIPCYIGDLHGLQLPSTKYEVITSFCVLPHHLTHPTPDLEAVVRILKKGGWFVLQLPADGPYRKVTKLAYRLMFPWRPQFAKFILANIYGPGGHQFAYTQQNLKEYLQICGFSEVTFSAYYPDWRITAARFSSKPSWFRASAFAAVALLSCVSRAFRLSNHMVVYARR